jgi:hypothetical protein
MRLKSRPYGVSQFYPIDRKYNNNNNNNKIEKGRKDF